MGMTDFDFDRKDYFNGLLFSSKNSIVYCKIGDGKIYKYDVADWRDIIYLGVVCGDDLLDPYGYEV